MLIRKSLGCGTAELASDRDDFVGNSIQSSRARRYRNLAHPQRCRSQRRRSVLERFCYLLPHLCFEYCPVGILRFVSCNQPKADPNVYGHENDERRAYAECQFPPARGNVRFARQQNLTRITMHARVDLSRDGQFALQLPIRNQSLLQRCTFRRGQSAVEIIEKFIWIHYWRLVT